MAYIACSGRLGNHMFQTAAAYAQSKRMGEPCYVTSKAILRFSNIAKYINLVDNHECTKQFYQGMSSGWASRRMPKPLPNLRMIGCFESEIFFADCINDIRDMFYTPEYQIDAVGVHIRRTDYLRLKRQHLTLDWYYRALTILKAKNVIVFSDDIEWCIDNFRWPNTAFSTTKDGFVDWCKLKSCQGFAIANSTYSWWAAYLSNSKHVICPKKWLRYDDETYRYLTNWTILEN